MLNEQTVEDWALALLAKLGYQVIHGLTIAPGEPAAERTEYAQVVLERRLREALARLNPNLPPDALEQAFRRVLTPPFPALLPNNRAFHRLLVDGVPVEFPRPDGTSSHGSARLIDFDNPERNDWLAVNQFSIQGPHHTRRPDIILFVNGLPLAVFELKNPTDTHATVWDAYNQLQTYKVQIPDLFIYNELLVISDGLDARLGSLTAQHERFQPWRTLEGQETAPTTMPQVQVLVNGVFEHRKFLHFIRHFITFEDNEKGDPEKKIAAYHQLHAVDRAVESTVAAAGPNGSRRCGVVWHTQGSGKSLTMVFYAGRLILHPALQNPTIVVITDRIDLDNQLFGVFARCHELLRQSPVQANDRDHLRELLDVASGGVVFTTLQKFMPPDGVRSGPLSERHNIVVIADEAHRSQYGFSATLDPKSGELRYGFAQHVRDVLPNASFLGFTGTPIEEADRNTREVFGDYISVYDIKQAVDDGATVPIYYENRSARLDLDEEEKPTLDEDFEEVTEGEETDHKEALKSKWTALAAIVGTDKRLSLIARDLVDHLQKREQVISGKAMIVCMSRAICVDLYNQLVKLRPEWHSDQDDQGALKVVITGSSSDRIELQPHIRNKTRRETMAANFRDPSKPFKIVIVRDMWLTGFDAPPLHTMYIDKPMHGHGLMQTIARVNRVFRDKPSGLIVDYLGLTEQLRTALSTYTASEGKGEPAIDQQKAIDDMLKAHDICTSLFHGFDWSDWTTGTPGERLSLLPAAQEHILDHEDGLARLNRAVKALTDAHTRAMPSDPALELREDVAFFQAVRSALTKSTASGRAISDEKLDHAVKQLVSEAIAPGEVIDIFSAVGLPRLDISILSDEFLSQIQTLPHKKLATEALNALLSEEIKKTAQKNVVQARRFSELLERALLAYRNRAIETAQVIEELILLAKEIRAAQHRNEELGLSPEELAFYDALEVNDSAVQVLGDQTLRSIAHELAATIRNSATIDWTLRESVQARMRVLVKRILRKYGYPPDKQEKATQTVVQQAELFAEAWAL
jgi:type I restriction enzyme, R subunit